MNSITVNNPVGLQTKGHLKFVVEIDGSVSNIDLVRGVVLDDPVLAQELDASIIQLANDLSFQSPGIDGGENVRVQVEFSVKVNLGRGEGKATIWTTDLSHEYIRINAEYRS